MIVCRNVLVIGSDYVYVSRVRPDSPATEASLLKEIALCCEPNETCVFDYVTKYGCIPILRNLMNFLQLG